MDIKVEVLEALAQMAVFSIAFMVLSTMSVSLRVYVRARILRAFGLDDWAILVFRGKSIPMRSHVLRGSYGSDNKL